MMIVMSVDFQKEMKRRYPHIYRNNFHYAYKPDVPLQQEQFDTIYKLFTMLQTVSQADSSNRWEMLGDLLDVLFLLLYDYCRQNGIPDHQPSQQEELFMRFHQAIGEHYRQSREVRYYANLFNLTPKHFAAVIKQHTHINASDWISSYVVMQAKMQLRHHRQKTIQEIALQLGFEDQAAFSRFFKSNAGVSPTDYRERG